MSDSQARQEAGKKIIAVNKQARRLYDLVETLEAGLALVGPEVKSLREGRVSFKDGYVRFADDGAWLVGVHFAPYENVSVYDRPDPERPRRLLLHRREIDRLRARVEQRGLTVVPVRMYFKAGRAKIEIALARGRNVHDKKDVIKQRDLDRDAERQLARYK